jgi:uncharacterized protein
MRAGRPDSPGPADGADAEGGTAASLAAAAALPPTPAPPPTPARRVGGLAPPLQPYVPVASRVASAGVAAALPPFVLPPGHPAGLGVDPRAVHVCFYHPHCPDGTLAAALLRRVAPRARFLPCVWDSIDPAVVTGRVVAFLDITPTHVVLRAVVAAAAAVMVADHHVGARDVLAALLPPAAYVFDTQECGASLTWAWIHRWLGAAAGPPPPVLPYAKALDLFDWRALEAAGDRDAMRMCRAYEVSTEATVDRMEAVLAEGEGFLTRLRANLGLIDTVVNLQLGRACAGVETVLLYRFPGVRVAVVNTQTYVNFLAHRLYTTTPVDLVWAWYHHGPSRRVRVMLRSGGRFDCNTYAAAFGGGGHPNAATFSCEPHAMRAHFCELPPPTA